MDNGQTAADAGGARLTVLAGDATTHGEQTLTLNLEKQSSDQRLGEIQVILGIERITKIEIEDFRLQRSDREAIEKRNWEESLGFFQIIFNKFFCFILILILIFLTFICGLTTAMSKIHCGAVRIFTWSAREYYW